VSEEPKKEFHKPSSDLNVGSKKWHLAMSAEIEKEALLSKDEKEVFCLEIRAAFHRLIGENQK